MTQAYIALSIHGSNKFIVATKDIPDGDYHTKEDITIAGKDFIIAQTKHSSIKLHISKFENTRSLSTNTKTAQALNMPEEIYNYFQELKNDGWQVDEIKEKAFAKYHKINILKDSEPKPIEEKTSPPAREVKPEETVHENSPSEKPPVEESKPSAENNNAENNNSAKETPSEPNTFPEKENPPEAVPPVESESKGE